MTVFADTYYFIALLSPRDSAHDRAVSFSNRNSRPIVTTAWILNEMADGLAKTPNRHLVSQVLLDLESNPQDTLVPFDQILWRRGLQLYDARPDKQWSLTDCISFVVMKDLDITEALTGDRHFQQAGFTALLAQPS
jgi:hypothetical protein